MSRTLRRKMGLSTIVVLFSASAVIALASRWDASPARPVSSRDVAGFVKFEKMMGKTMAPLSVQLGQPESIPEKDGEEVHLTGYVTLNQAIASEVFFQWELPAGVSAISGDLSGSLTGMHVGDVAEVDFTIIGFSKTSAKQIVLHSHVHHGSDDLGNSALLSSRPEDSLEFVAQASANTQKKPGKKNS